MLPVISLTRRSRQMEHLILVVESLSHIPESLFTEDERSFILHEHKDLEKDLVSMNRLGFWVFIHFIKPDQPEAKRLEACIKAWEKTASILNEHHIRQVYLFDYENRRSEILACAEGMALGSYQFRKYRKEKKGAATLKEIGVYSSVITGQEVHMMNILLEAVYRCRDWVNEPVSSLNAEKFAHEMETMAKETGILVEVMNRKKIESLKMGGILGVNQGSSDPPTFTILEFKSPKARNQKPLVLVGKGIMYDSGGTNLKPGSSLTGMKNDMSGAAAVASVIYAIARAELPVHVIGLIPATDNRIGPKSIVPGDIIRTHDGTTIEIIDTDAEGRLILADALSCAKKYDPMLVIDLATLTGSAIRAIGTFAAAAMQVKAEKEMDRMKESGWITGERIWEFPMWEEYGEMMKSDLADLKNLGPAEAGTITAAKFLEKFIDFPWIHLDMAGPAFTEKRDGYRGQGGTGFGVRLLFNFVQKI